MSHKLHLQKTRSWAPNGPMDYARSVRKYNISPTTLSSFFVRDGVLKRFLPSEHMDHDPKGVSPGSQRFMAHMKTTFGKKDRKQAPGTQATTPAGSDPDGANEGQGETEVGADDVQNDQEYVVPVSIDGQTLQLDFDTGSSDLWVLSTSSGLTAAQAAEHTLFNPGSTAAVQGESWNISYGDGSSASGTVYTFQITLNTLSIPNQAVEVATAASSSFASPGSDGLLGLAWPSINTVSPRPVATPVENMISEKLIEQPLFSCHLTKGGADSFYTFGYVDTSVALTSAFTTIDVINTNGFWEFPTKAITINGVSTKRDTTAIADTGTTLLLVDDASVEAVYAQVKGAKMSRTQGGYVFPSTATLPDIGFEVNGSTFTIPGSDLIFSDAGSGTSFGSIQSRGQNPQDIWGDVFLKRVYAVFNQGDKTIAFAQRST